MTGLFIPCFPLLLASTYALNTEFYIPFQAGQLLCSETYHETGICKSVTYDIKHLSCILKKSASDPLSGHESRMLTFKKVSMCVPSCDESGDGNTTSSVSLCKQIRLGTSNQTAFTEVDLDFPHIQKVVTARDADQTRKKDNTSSKSQSKLTIEATRAEDVKLDQHSCSAHLQQVCEKGRLFIVKFILTQGRANINCRGQRRRTPVMLAAWKGQVKVFNYLVSQGCDMSVVDQYNNNVLHVACMGGNADIARKLIDSGACGIESRGKYDRRPIMWAAYCGHREMFQLLEGKGCDLTAADTFKYNVLHAACISGSVELVQYILSLNIFSLEVRGYNGMTPIMAAARDSKKGMVHYLVGRGCKLTVVDDSDNNILHIACMQDNVYLLKYLMTLKNMERLKKAKNRYSETPAQVADKHGNKQLIRLLKGRK